MSEYSRKVYEVETGVLEGGKNGRDIQNCAKFTIIACNAKDAISTVDSTFKLNKTEYIVGMKVVAVLD